ncbi:FHA domain-containing protein [Herbiconiux liukaitaii]|uniref:FHA domain-containing protein n=1 Tax=Herbiconiux liukaitaii TaxID=3342799 RepID=UPI0035B83B9F
MKCRTCGTTLSAGALLCGECGTSAIAPRPTLGDTARFDRKALLDTILREQRRAAAARQSATASAGRPPHTSARPITPAVARWTAPPVDETSDDSTAAIPTQVAPERDPLTPSIPATDSPAAAAAALASAVAPEHEPTVAPEHDPAIAPESNRGLNPDQAPEPQPATPRHAAPQKHDPSRPLYSLVFSTGESVRVSGSGLVGRNPTPLPGEHVDYLVQIVDPARSVSKTHLVFGLENGEFWVADRGSSNGTRLGLDLVDPVELTPGERIRIPRGTRVGIADQYFDLH